MTKLLPTKNQTNLRSSVFFHRFPQISVSVQDTHQEYQRFDAWHSWNGMLLFFFLWGKNASFLISKYILYMVCLRFTSIFGWVLMVKCRVNMKKSHASYGFWCGRLLVFTSRFAVSLLKRGKKQDQFRFLKNLYNKMNPTISQMLHGVECLPKFPWM